jgi:hypothetical protein
LDFQLISFSRYTEDDSVPKPPTIAAEVKAEATAEADVKTEHSNEQYGQNGQNGQNGDGDEQMYTGDQDADDEIDFNLGNGNSYDTPPTHEAHGPGIKEDG